MKKLFAIASALILSLSLLSACAENPANYIGVDSAKSIAFENAGVTSETSVKDLDVELDREIANAVYEVSFDFEGYEYEYDIDAVSGEIVRNHRELDSLPPENFYSVPDVTTAPEATTAPESPTEAPEEVATAAAETVPDGTIIPASLIGADEAKRIALEHAGLSESEVWDLEAERDVERGVEVYDVSFETEEYDYDYDINAVTGEIVRADKERDRNNAPAQQAAPAATTAAPAAPAATTAADGYIGEEAAKKAAFDHAGLNEADVWELKCNLEREDGVMVYDISFETEGYDYDYEINATSGEIVKHEKERDSTNVSPSAADANGYIGYDRAKEIALEHAGLTADGVSRLEAELDSERTKVVYDVSFDANGYEYDYEIDASTGEILKSDKERD